MALVRVYQRTSQSYDVALEQYRERVAAGLQPSTRVVDLFNVETEEAILLGINLCYLMLVILLFLRMLVSSSLLNVLHLRSYRPVFVADIVLRRSIKS